VNRIRPLAALAGSLGLLLAAAPGASAATITVNSTADTTLDTGTCTLREAIVAANTDTASGATGGECAAGSGADTINFSAAFDGPGGGTSDTIALAPATSLPSVTEQAAIDGGNCGTATAPEPCAAIDAAGADILQVTADDSTVRGLAFKGASDTTGHDSFALAFSTANRLSIRNNWFGVGLDGSLEANRISVAGVASDDIVVGSATSAADRNVFAASAFVGLSLKNTDRARVQGNYFGTLADGTTATTGTFPTQQIMLMSDNGVGGIQVGTLIGGPEAGVPGACEAPCNVIVGSALAGFSGIRLENPGGIDPAGQTAVEGNFLGLSATGGALGAGHVKVGSADDVTIGGDASRRNYATEITADGGATNLDVVSNFVGLNPAGTVRFADGTIDLGQAPSGLISAPTVTDNRIARSPVAPPSSPINLDATGAIVHGNTIGIGTGGQDVGGGAIGIALAGGSGNQIGGTSPGDANVIGNTGTSAGIFLTGAETGTTVAGNVLGTDATGTTAEPLGGPGIRIQGTNNTVGGTTAAAENVISNAAGSPIRVDFNGNDGNQLLRNRGIGNAGIFIDLTDGGTGVGQGVVATAANTAIAEPAITPAPTTTSVSGTGAVAGATIRVYTTFTAATGEIRSFVGSAVDADGGAWTVNYPTALTTGECVTVNQTDSSGNSSELAPAQEVGGGALPCTVPVPDTTIDSGPTGTITDSTPTFAFSSNQGGVSFDCRFDAAPFAPCSGPGATHTPAAPLADGAHSFEVRARFPDGTLDTTPASRSFTVETPVVEPPPSDGGAAAADTTPPDTQITDGPKSKTKKKTATFEFTSTEPGSTFECKLDDGQFQPCTSPHDVKAKKGKHTFEVRARDAAGNVDPTPAEQSWTVKKKKR